MSARSSSSLSLALAVLLACAAPAGAQIGRSGEPRTSEAGEGAATKQRGKTGTTDPAQKQAAKTGAPAKKAPPGVPRFSPIVFYLAKGEPHACGPGCSEWIAAEGVIDGGAAPRLRALLERLGPRKLPIFFHSPGGSVDDAFEIGKLLRARNMKAGVGRTIPQGCDATGSDAACNALKRAGPPLVADLDTTRTHCMSACVYAFVGAAVREVPAAAQLGVHSSRIVVRVKSDRPVPANHPVLRSLVRERQQAGDARRAAYIRQMGIDKGLLDVIYRTKHEDMHFLSRAEIARYGIDTRELVERAWTVEFDARRDSAWWTLNQSWPGLAAVKLLYDGRDRNGYRAAFVSFACVSKDHLAVTFGRERTAGEAALLGAIKAVTRGGDFDFAPEVSTVLDTTMRAFAVRRARVPIALMEAAAAGDTIEITEAAERASEVPPRVTKLSTFGLARSLRHCNGLASTPSG
jgi:hypothetical protein